MKRLNFLYVQIAVSMVIFMIYFVHTEAKVTTNNIIFDHMSSDDGLSNNSVNWITQDREGFIWIGTADGLNMYDGYNFKVFSNKKGDKKSIPNNFVYYVFVDSKGDIWLGTDGGLSRFNRDKENFTNYTHNPKDSNSLPYDTVQWISEDKDGNIWAGTYGGLAKLNQKTGDFKSYKYNKKNKNSLSSDAIMGIDVDQNGQLWISTDDGLNRLDPKTDKIKVYYHDKNDPYSLSSSDTSSVNIAKDGKIWVATADSGLNKLDPQTGKCTRYMNNPDDQESLSNNMVIGVLEDSSDNIWVFTDGGGTNLLTEKTGKFKRIVSSSSDKYSLSNDSIMTACEDSTGNIWFGNYKGGINIYKNGYFNTYFMDPANNSTLSNNIVHEMYQDKSGIIWIGTEYGLNALNPETGKITRYTSDPKNPHSIQSDMIMSVYEDSYGYLWIGSYGDGLIRFNRKNNSFKLYTSNTKNGLSDDIILTIFEDSDKILWIGSYGGISRYNSKNDGFINYENDLKDKNSIPLGAVRSIDETKDKTLWIGTDGGGLCKFNKNTGKFKSYKVSDKSNSIVSNNISNLLIDKDGIIWIGTWGLGLNRFDPKKEKFTLFDKSNNLPSGTIHKIVQDREGYLWLGTTKGLVKFNPQGTKNNVIKVFDTSDGLRSNEFMSSSGIITKDGEIYLGGTSGFISFYPSNIKIRKTVPLLTFTGFRKFDKLINLNKNISLIEEINLRYFENFFAFEFSILDFKNPAHNNYKYMLDGFDKTWIDAGNRNFANYTNLNGGTYKFKVKGANSDGTWNNKGISLKIDVQTPPWKTWWAYTFYILVIIAAIGFYLNLKNKAHKIEIEKQQALVEKMKEMDKLKDEHLAETNYMNLIFSYFVPKEFINILNLNSITDIKLGDQVEKNMTIMFSDIRSFTTMSESMTPKENFDFINSYLEQIGPIIRNHKGFIDKYMGDGVMAIFDGNPINAINASVAIQRKLEQFNQKRLEKNDIPVNTGIGLHFGRIMLGTIGEECRLNTTVISDTVNLASRLEGLTKFYYTNLIVSKNVIDNLADCKGHYSVRFLDIVKVKGKEIPVMIYEILDALPSEDFARKMKTLKIYENAIFDYNNKDFERAQEKFEQALSIDPKDRLIANYIDRCKKSKQNKEIGAVVFTEK